MADVYLPLRVTNDPSALLWLSCVKLKPGVSTRSAEAEFQSLLEVFANQAPAHFPEKFHIRLRPLSSEHDITFIHTLYLLFVAVALMFWIGCANFSILHSLAALRASTNSRSALQSAHPAVAFWDSCSSSPSSSRSAARQWEYLWHTPWLR